MKRYLLLTITKITELPSVLPADCTYYALLLAIDAHALSDHDIYKLADALLSRGLVYLCVWGRDCERFHDLFDSRRSFDETQETVIMTTWHSRDSLKEVIEFFVCCAEPADVFLDKCQWIAAAQADAAWLPDMTVQLASTVADSCGAALSIR